MIIGQDDDEDKAITRMHRIFIYDIGRAYNYMMSDWLGTVPRFHDMQFKRTFRIKRSLVDYIIGNLARYDSFWTQSQDATN